MKKKFKYLKESPKFKKYWEIRDYNTLSKKEADDLIKLYKKFRSARNRCTAAIFLSHIDNDDRIPPILFDALKYWDNSEYAGWVVTSNGRLFNYYPKFRKTYLDLMFNGNFIERRILSGSLFFIQEKLRDISCEELLKIKKKFVRKEKNLDLKKHILGHLNLKDALDFAKSLLVHCDPLDLIKNGAKKNVYDSVYYELVGFYKNKTQKRRKLKFIKSSYIREFGKAPSDKIVEKMMDKVMNVISKKI